MTADKKTIEEINGKSNLGIGIANAAWVIGVCSVIIFAHASPWFLVVPILFNWSFIRPKERDELIKGEE